MAKYINAERLKDSMFAYYDCLEESANGRPYKGDTLMDYEVVDMIGDCIDSAPPADVVEVVRCGECTKWDAHEGDEYGTCANGDYVSRNDYCCWGERRTDDGNL